MSDGAGMTGVAELQELLLATDTLQEFLDEAERAAIVALFEVWGEIDRSHRKLAHRGSRLGLVHVSESTVRRVLAAEDLVLPGQPAREPTPRTPWPRWRTRAATEVLPGLSCGVTVRSDGRPLTSASSDGYANKLDQLQYRLAGHDTRCAPVARRPDRRPGPGVGEG